MRLNIASVKKNFTQSGSLRVHERIIQVTVSDCMVVQKALTRLLMITFLFENFSFEIPFQYTVPVSNMGYRMISQAPISGSWGTCITWLQI